MSTTTGLPPNVDEYLAALSAELADLAPEEREDLLSEVEPSLLEAAAESDGGEPLAARLGAPAHFAADLRASAGLPPAPPPEPARTGVKISLRDLAAHPAVAKTVAVLRELAPVWWVVRAYVAVMTLSIVTDQGPESAALISRYPEVPRFGSAEAGLVVLALALAASIAAGIAARRRPQRYRNTRIAANLALAVLVFPVAGQLQSAATVPVETTVVTEAASPPSGLTLDGSPITNVYAYDRTGRLLHDVRLYDSFGKPLDIGRGVVNADRRPVRDADGGENFNAFPIRYFEPGTQRVANPDAGSPVAPPALTTPPLPVKPVP